MEHLLWILLGGVVFPLWLLCGLADYACHGRTGLAHASGVRESAMHLLQTAQIGLPMLAYLLLAHTATVFLLMALGVALHTATAYADVRYTAPRRRIPVAEHFVHGFLVVLPMVALALAIVLEWPRLRAQPWPAAGPWALRFAPAFDPATIAAVLAAAAVFGVLPGVLEFAHAWRVAHGERAKTAGLRARGMD